MPSVIIRPDVTVSAGNWSVSDLLIADILGDQNATTEIFNSSANQEVVMTLTDVSDGLGLQQFTSATITVSAKKSGKGDGNFKAILLDSSSTIIHSANFTVQDAIYINFTTTANINFHTSDINDLRLSITTTLGTQVLFNEAFVTVVYGESLSDTGKITLSSGLIQLTSGKVTL